MNDMSTDDLAKILWDYNKLDTKLETADCILALGSHDTRVATRAGQLFLDGYAPLLMFSGGFGRLTEKSWTKSEAEMFEDVALKMGIPKSQIILENKSTNTAENIEFSLKILTEKELIPKKVILVTKPYMERRAYATFKIRFPEIDIITASPTISYEDYPNEIISKDEMINIMVGDTQRIKLYPPRGFMLEQEIPNNVWLAFEELVKRGFTQHLVKD